MEVEIFFSEALLEFFVLLCGYSDYFRNFATQLLGVALSRARNIGQSTT